MRLEPTRSEHGPRAQQAEAFPLCVRQAPRFAGATSWAGLAAILLTGLSGCVRDNAASTIFFRDVTHDRGLPAREPYPDGRYFMPEITASGVALLDYDADGDLDIYQVMHPPPQSPPAKALACPAPNRLHRQEADGHFREVGAAAGVADPGYGQGVAVGDIDGDGYSELYVVNYGPNRLFRNLRDGTFEDATPRAGLDDEASRLWGSSAAFLDFDRDGDLDLFLVNYVQLEPEIVCVGEAEKPDYCGPTRFLGSPGALYRNRGDGHFDNVTAAAGVGRPGRGLGVACADFTGDDLVDIYVANDREANCLWVNRGDGTFRDEGLARGVALSGSGNVESSMGVAVGDVDSNGALDLLVTNLSGETNTLYVAQGSGQFADRSASSGLSSADLPFTGWGCAFLDLEGDGDLDLAVVNGRIARGRTAAEGVPVESLNPFWKAYSERNLLYQNDGRGRFSSLEARGGAFTAGADNQRGLAAGDLDGDGDTDLVSTGADNHLNVFLNQSPRLAHWIRIRALCGSRDALGALLTVGIAGESGAPGRALVRSLLPAQSYASSSEPWVHAGLGNAKGVEFIDVVWPDGKRERLRQEPGVVDREITLRQGEGEAR